MHPSVYHTIKIQRAVLSLMLVLGMSFLAWKAVMSGRIVLMGAVIAIPIAVYFINNPSHLLMASFLVGAAGITVRGIPGGFSLQNVLHAAVIGLGIAFLAMSKGVKLRKEYSTRFLIGFLIVLAVTMAVRGTGIRFLGSTQWGGRGYLVILLASTFYMLSSWIRLTTRHIHFLVIGLLIAGVVPFMVQAMFLLSGGKIYFLAYFVEAHLQSVAGATFNPGQGITRMSTLRYVGQALLPLAFVFPYVRPNRWLIPSLLVVASFAFTALSGFRSEVIWMAAVCGLWGVVAVQNEDRKKYFLALGMIAMAGWLLLIVAGDRLPFSMQRAAAFVPLAKISPIAESNASVSTDWRLDIWKLAWEEIPDYLLVGKGMCFDPDFFQLMNLRNYNTPEKAFLRHNYHSGPVGALLDFGAFGFLFLTLFLLFSCREHLAAVKRFKDRSIWNQYYRYVAVVYLWEVISFYAIFGDMQETFTVIIITGALLRILRYSLDEAASDPQPETVKKKWLRPPPAATQPRQRQPAF